MPIEAAPARPGRPVRAPRDLDNILWRGPAGLKKRIVDVARDNSLSQNAFITSSLLYSTIVVGTVRPIGSPTNLCNLLEEMQAALDADDAILSAMHLSDWELVREFVQLLADGNIIDGLKTRIDRTSSETVAFTFHFTKEGAAAWRVFGSIILEAIKKLGMAVLPEGT